MAQKRNQNRNRNKSFSFSFSFSFSHLVHFPAAFHHINNTADCARRGSRSSPTERACRPVSVQRLAIRQSTAATKHNGFVSAFLHVCPEPVLANDKARSATHQETAQTVLVFSPPALGGLPAKKRLLIAQIFLVCLSPACLGKMLILETKETKTSVELNKKAFFAPGKPAKAKRV